MHLIVLVDTWQEQLAGTPVTFLLFKMFIICRIYPVSGRCGSTFINLHRGIRNDLYTWYYIICKSFGTFVLTTGGAVSNTEGIVMYFTLRC